MTIANRDPEDGSVMIQPRNIMTTGLKKGGIDKVLFSAPSKNCDEPYVMPGNAIARKTNMNAITGAGHEKNWTYAKVKKEGMQMTYEHMTDRREVVKNFRDEEGNVVIAPRNFLTNPIKKGRVGKNTTFGGQIPFKHGDDYMISKEIATKERAYHESKLQDKPFSQMSRRNHKGLFNKDSEMFDLKDHIKPQVRT